MAYLRIKNWDKYQHYKYQKSMPWFKCYGRDLLINIEWSGLSLDKQGFLVNCWALGSEKDGFLPDIRTISFRLRLPEEFVKETLAELKDWFQYVDKTVIENLYTGSIPDKIILDKTKLEEIKLDNTAQDAEAEIPF